MSSTRKSGDKRPALRMILPSAAVLVCALAIALAGCGGGDKRPDVVVVIIDTLRADFLGCYGARPSVTPNIDRLAAGGARFTQCVTAVPVTLPSISSILTSSYPVYHGVRDNGIFALDQSLVTMAEAFKEAGYATGAVVGAYVIGEQSGIAQGFDHFDCEFSGDYKNESSLLKERAEEISRTQRRASEVTERAVEWLESVPSPFFLMVHYFDPHGPYDPPAQFKRKYQRSRAYGYLGEIAYTDAHLGPLLQAAESAAGARGLITALVADHGEGLGQHNEMQHGFLLYDTTLLVPLIVHYPGQIPPAMTADDQVSTIDLAPTVLVLSGIPVPPTWQGESLAQRIAVAPIDEASEPPPERPAAHPCYIETYRTRYSYHWSELSGVRYNGWKFIRAPRSELYNLAEDPGEKANLYELKPDQAKRMESLLDEIVDAMSGPLGESGPSVTLDSESIEKLKALGYVMPKEKPPVGPLPDPKDKMAGLNTRLQSKEVVKKARALMNSGDVDGARRELERAIELDPTNAVAFHDIGAIHFQREEFEEALPFLERAASLSPTSELPREHLGMAYMRLGRPRDAARELEAAAALEPEKAGVRLSYGLALLDLGDLKGALQQFHKSIELDPGQAPPYYHAALVLNKMGRTDEAAATISEMLTKNPSKELAERGRRLLSEIQTARRR